MKKAKLIVILLFALSTSVACMESSENESVQIDDTDTDAGTEDTGADNSATDTGGDEDEDVYTIGDVGDSSEGDYRCGDLVIQEWPLNDSVSTGSAIAEEQDDYHTLTIDADAGGFQAATNNPFVYVSLETGEKVEVTDLESLDDDSWDLAFKRVVIRTNSGDSGPGDLELIKISNTTFEDVTAVPGPGVQTGTDLSFDLECGALVDSIGNLYTAFNYLNQDNPSGSRSWYDYGSGGGMGVAPVEGDIYIISNNDSDRFYKMEILSWESAIYTIRWAELTQ